MFSVYFFMVFFLFFFCCLPYCWANEEILMSPIDWLTWWRLFVETCLILVNTHCPYISFFIFDKESSRLSHLTFFPVCELPEFPGDVFLVFISYSHFWWYCCTLLKIPRQKRVSYWLFFTDRVYVRHLIIYMCSFLFLAWVLVVSLSCVWNFGNSFSIWGISVLMLTSLHVQKGFSHVSLHLFVIPLVFFQTCAKSLQSPPP